MAGLQNTPIKFLGHLQQDLDVELTPALLENKIRFLVQGSLGLLKTLMQQKRDRAEDSLERKPPRMHEEHAPSMLCL